MKNRIWFAIYWTVITYSLLTVLVLIVSFTSWKDTPIEKDPALANTLKITKNLNQKLLFNFIEYRMEDCYFYRPNPFGWNSYSRDRQDKCRTDKVSSRKHIKINNIYPLLLIMLLFFIRWIVTGKNPNEIEKIEPF